MKKLLRPFLFVVGIGVLVFVLSSFRQDSYLPLNTRNSSVSKVDKVGRPVFASEMVGRHAASTKGRITSATSFVQNQLDRLPHKQAQLDQIPSVPHVILNGHAVHPSRILMAAAPIETRESSQHYLESLGLTIVSETDTVTIVELAGDIDDPNRADTLARAIKEVRASGLFGYAEPDFVVTVNLEPNDAAYVDGRLWGLKNTSRGIDIDAARAWGVTTGSSNVIVAVIDTGIRYTHRDLSSRMWRNPGEIAGNGVDDDNDGFVDNIYGMDAFNRDGDPMDDHSHGTHCAGTIGASANDGYEHVGVAWNVRLMACKFLSAEGSGYLSDAVKCIDWAVSKGAKVLSNSWGGGGYSQTMYDSIARAKNSGVLFIAAAGNSASDNDTTPAYPASYALENVISVAAVDLEGRRAWWSNYGRNTVHLGAPGVGIYSTVADADDAYAIYSGTSMATPHVAGVAALLLSHRPSSTIEDLRARLINTTRPLADLSGKTVSGGMVHAYNALLAQGDGVLELAVTADPNPLNGGRTAKFIVSVTDTFPVLDATVNGTLGGLGNVTFKDNGVAPDSVAADGIYTGQYLIPATPSLTTINLSVQVSATGKTSSNTSVSFVVRQASANDLFANRKLITSNSYTFSGASNINASAETGEPPHYNRWYVVPARKSVWFTWKAPANGRVDMNTVGSNFDTVLSVYTGTTLTALTRVAQDDDSGGNLASKVVFYVRKNGVYQIAIDGYGGESGDIRGAIRFLR